MTYSLIIHSIIQETSDVKSFQFTSQEKIIYQAGQFLTLIHPLSKGIRRSYSLSSHPLSDQFPQITVKRIANGEFSRWLFDNAKEGDKIETIGASGFFTLPESLPTDATLLFLAAGSGITPILSLIKEVLFNRGQKIILIYSNRTEKETIFFNYLNQLREEFSTRLTVYFLFSNNQNLSHARLSKSLLSDLIQQDIPNRAKALTYLCGPHDYMQMVGIVLLNENFLSENIRTEKFIEYQTITKELPPDIDQHKVIVDYQGKRFSLDVKYPVTVLQAAKNNNIDLPYSCEAGRCGTCAATCVSGKIWMSRNEVLLDKEINNGRILICTGHPIGGDAELIIN